MTIAREKPPSEIKIALDNRAFELQLFWQRSNYFLVLMTALGIGAFTIKDALLSPLISLFATVSSYLWLKTNLGSKFWQENWELEVSILAKELGIRSFERSNYDCITQVKKHLGENSKRSFIRRYVDKQIVTKPSVTYHMIFLSFFSLIVWLIVSIIFIYRFLFSVQNLNQSSAHMFRLIFS